MLRDPQDRPVAAPKQEQALEWHPALAGASSVRLDSDFGSLSYVLLMVVT